MLSLSHLIVLTKQYRYSKMAVVKITDLPDGDTTFTNKDVVLVVDFEDNTTKKVQAANMRTYMLDETLLNEAIDARLRYYGLIP